jgi:hypothetical protein
VRRSRDAEGPKLNSDKDVSGSRKYKRATVVFAFGGTLESGGRFWQESGFSRNEDVLIFNLFKKKFCTSFTFNVICKNNDEIQCITVQRKKVHSRQL